MGGGPGREIAGGWGAGLEKDDDEQADEPQAQQLAQARPGDGMPGSGVGDAGQLVHAVNSNTDCGATAGFLAVIHVCWLFALLQTDGTIGRVSGGRQPTSGWPGRPYNG